MGDRIVSAILKKLGSEPRTREGKLAGVSVIIDAGDKARTLLIKRAERTGDPWSGQVAFPGGKMQGGDGSVLHTAIRETLEEVGVDLARNAEFLGYLGSFRTHVGSMGVVPSVFKLKARVKVTPNEEVSDFKWVAFESFLERGSASTFSFEARDARLEMPAYRVEGYVIWGLTFRIIESLLEGLSE